MKRNWFDIMPPGWEKMTPEELETWYMALDERTREEWSRSYRMTGPVFGEVTGHFELTEEQKKSAEEWKEKIRKGEPVM